jgi:nucleotide-binding universal stress UspA family protein
MSASPGPRVIVGVDDSLAGLEAIRTAVAEARRRGAVLLAVRAWSLPSAGLGPSLAASSAHLWRQDAVDRLRAAFDAALGAMPRDVAVQVLTPQGGPAPALVSVAVRDDDLLVVGVGRQGWLRRVLAGSVAAYCLAHAPCPVLAVPPHALARQLGRRRLLVPDRWRHVGGWTQELPAGPDRACGGTARRDRPVRYWRFRPGR